MYSCNVCVCMYACMHVRFIVDDSVDVAEMTSVSVPNMCVRTHVLMYVVMYSCNVCVCMYAYMHVCVLNA